MYCPVYRIIFGTIPLETESHTGLYAICSTCKSISMVSLSANTVYDKSHMLEHLIQFRLEKCPWC